MLIERMTLAYSKAEDRIRLDGVDGGGATCGLWLTRRLACGLLQAMAKWLKEASPSAARTAPALQSDVLSLEHAAIAATRSAGGPPVLAAPAAILAVGIDMRRRDNRFQLDFQDAAGQVHATLRVERQRLHWLADALVRQMRRGNWTDAIALDWLAEESGLAKLQAPSGALLN